MKIITSKNTLLVFLGVAGILVLQALIYLNSSKPKSPDNHSIRNNKEVTQRKESFDHGKGQMEMIHSINDHLDKVLSDQESAKLSSALLYEEVDKIRRSLEALTDLNSENREAVDSLEPLTDEEQDLIQEQRMIERSELYTETMNAESSDGAWSKKSETEITNFIAETDNKIVAESVECRETLCELKIRRGENTLDEDAVEAFNSQVDWPGEMEMTYHPQTGLGTVYLSRVGHALPRLPDET